MSSGFQNGVILDGLGGSNTLSVGSLSHGLFYDERFGSYIIARENTQNGRVAYGFNFQEVESSSNDDVIVALGKAATVDAGEGSDQFFIQQPSFASYDGGSDSGGDDNDVLIVNCHRPEPNGAQRGVYVIASNDADGPTYRFEDIDFPANYGFNARGMEGFQLSVGADILDLTVMPEEVALFDGSTGLNRVFGDSRAGEDVMDPGPGGEFVTHQEDDEGNVVAGFVRVDDNEVQIANFTVLAGTHADDTILGHLRPNELYGNDGADVITGHGGFDFIVGGKGDDTLIGDLRHDDPALADLPNADVDYLLGGEDFDTYYASAGDIIFDNSLAPPAGLGAPDGEGQVFFDDLLLTGGTRFGEGTEPSLTVTFNAPDGTGLDPITIASSDFDYYSGDNGEYYALADTNFYFLDAQEISTTVLAVAKENADDPLIDDLLFIMAFDPTASSYLGITLNEGVATSAAAMASSGGLAIDDHFDFGAKVKPPQANRTLVAEASLMFEDDLIDDQFVTGIDAAELPDLDFNEPLPSWHEDYILAA